LQTKTVSTINCPRCQQVLPGWSTACQFCGSTITAGYVRPTDAYKYKIDNRLGWKDIGYIAVSLIIAAQGAYLLLQGLKIVPSAIALAGGDAYLGIVGAVDLLFGLGLLFHVGWIQFVMRLRCFLGLAHGSLSLVLGLMMFGYTRHPWPQVLSSLWTVVLLGFTLYFINELGDV
jgi:hypothetical protein